MVYMLFSWQFSGILWHPGGIPWDTEDRIILTVELYGIWDSDKISEWKAMDIATLLTMGVEYTGMPYNKELSKSATFPNQCWT